MKKICKLAIIILGIFIITGCNKSIESISYKEFNDLLKNKKTFVIEVIQDGCSHCIEYEPIFTKTINKNKVVAYNLNIKKLNKNDFDKFKEKYSFEGTPTTMFFKKGEEVLSSRIIGSTTEEKLTKTLKRLNYIK